MKVLLNQFYTDDDLKRLYDKSYFEDRYEQNKQNWYVKANFIKRVFSPTRILDIGCAEGFLVKELSNLGIESYGIDGSQYALEKAPNELHNKLFRVNLNKDKFPFDDESFDFVCSLHTIEHVHNLEHFALELFRILKPGGKAWIVTPDVKHDPKNVHDVNMKIYSEWKKIFNSYQFIVKSQRQYGFLELRGKLRKLRLYKIPEPVLTWTKYLVYWYLNNFYKKGGKEASFLLVKRN